MEYIKGIDISNNNGEIDFKKVATDNVEFVYMKASEGKTFQDSMMESFYNSCKSNGLKVGAYHFLVGSSYPEAQAENFYRKIKEYEWDLIPILDIEREFYGLCDYVVRFIDAFKKLCPLQLGIYSYTGFISNIESIQNTIKDYPFWEANYNNVPWNLPSNFFNNKVGHQFTETGNIVGIDGKVDVNSFNEGILLKNNSYLETWINDKNKWWYKHKDGTCTKGAWEFIDGKWYYFNEEGIMQTGWIKVDYKWYHLDNNGAMETGWIKDAGKDYCLYSNGEMIHDCTIYGYKFDCSGIAAKASQ
ncbi:glycoside hydrolase [Clostridium chromiireducens]|uniref:Glycoside hydrolase n=1 Tax=Clostridium chromiireducens TaxID=225345 RepID=A0A399IPT4_9CLOT|nr:GH25 family lysozyme [Clostridium chromiireducens]RII35035.1 glycoside hydrolase [Clostridium chromiireducens]